MLNLVSRSAEVALTLADLKKYKWINYVDEDSTLNDIIADAMLFCEKQTGRSMITSTWLETFCDWPSIKHGYYNVRIVPQRLPLVSVTSIKYLNNANVLITLSPSLYAVNLGVNSASITLQNPPGLTSDYFENKVQIVYISGPTPFAKRMILNVASHMYDKRSGEEIEKGLQNVFASYQNWSN